jgi:hypothetical protein
LRIEAAMTGTDVVDVLLHQHDRMRRLCALVREAEGADKRLLFAELDREVSEHELGDEAVVHPAAREGTAFADAVSVACRREEGDIGRDLAELRVLGVRDASFESRFAAVDRAIHEHTAREERDEFPLLRLYVSTQRLHMMVGQLHDVKIMADG